MAGYYRDIIKILKANGCTFVRQGKGYHEIWYSPITNRNFTVDKGVEVKHTANGSLEDAGIDEAF